MWRPGGLKPPDAHEEVWDISGGEWQAQREGKKECSPMSVFCSDSGLLDPAYREMGRRGEFNRVPCLPARGVFGFDPVRDTEPLEEQKDRRHECG